MILTANLTLVVSPDEDALLRHLVYAVAAARKQITSIANENKVTRWLDINRVAYHIVRADTGLPANLVQSLIRQVASAFKQSPNARVRSDAAIPMVRRYIKPSGSQSISLKVADRRLKLPFLCAAQHLELLKHTWRGGDLEYRGGKWFLHLTCVVPEPLPLTATDVIGVDFGIVNIATDSSGEAHSGEEVQEVRRTFVHRRRNLQKKRTRAAKRKLRTIKRKQSRFQAHVNHIIAKRIVAKAFDTGCVIAIEDLKGIRSRVNVRRRQRAMLHNWGFFQLRTFIEYKAKRLGVTVVTVAPKNTSRGCPECGHISKSNRQSRDVFVCQSCGCSGPADSIAARNIRARALADTPLVAGTALQQE